MRKYIVLLLMAVLTLGTLAGCQRPVAERWSDLEITRDSVYSDRLVGHVGVGVVTVREAALATVKQRQLEVVVDQVQPGKGLIVAQTPAGQPVALRFAGLDERLTQLEVYQAREGDPALVRAVFDQVRLRASRRLDLGY